MYYPQQQKEPSGCLQTVIITRIILSILFIPLFMIGSAIFLIILTFYLFTISAPLALIPIVTGALGLVALGRWEQRRVAKENPPDDQ